MVLKSLSGASVAKAKNIVKEQVGSFFGKVPNSHFTGIGGTITCITAIVLGLKVYDSKKVHGYLLSKKDISYAEEYLLSHTAEEVAKETCVQLKRAEILPFGLQILKEIFSLLKPRYYFG